MNNIIHILIGLPGSGKSTHINKYYKGWIKYDDYYMCDKKLFEDSIFFDDLIKSIKNNMNIVISDVVFCVLDKLKYFEKKLSQYITQNFIVEKIYFDNNITLCKQNVLYRNRESKNRELNIIDRFSKKYNIPDNSKIIKIYNGFEFTK